MAMALLAGACVGSSDEAAPTPEPTVAIAGAPTATPEPAATATPEPTAAPSPTPEPTEVELSVEEQVIAAWERYLDLSIQARGKEPSREALAIEGYAAEGAQRVLEDLLVQQKAEGRYIGGAVTSLAPTVRVEDGGDAQLDDCIFVDLLTFDDDDRVTLETSDRRTVVARLIPVDRDWRVVALESGDPCGA